MIDWSQLLLVGLFLLGVAMVYYLALRWIVVKIRRGQPKTFADRILHRLGPWTTVLALFGLACMAYGRFIEPYGLTVTTYRIETEKIPAGETVRIVQLADLHVREDGPRERALPALVTSLKPDIIVHTGDLFGKKACAESVLVRLMKAWDCPQYSCSGNLDYLGDYSQVMRESGVHDLNRAKAIVTVRTARICIDGFGVDSFWAMPSDLGKLPDETYNVVLFHRPSGFPLTWGSKADLMLSGHTHGGQIRLPFFGALVTMELTGKRWEYGLYEEEGKKLIVSRGIGCEPYTFELRFLCPPEVVVVDLVGVDSTPTQSAVNLPATS